MIAITLIPQPEWRAPLPVAMIPTLIGPELDGQSDRLSQWPSITMNVFASMAFCGKTGLRCDLPIHC